MKYRKKKVEDALTEEILFELMQRIDMVDAPVTKRLYGRWEEGTIGIGNDNIAVLLLPVEDKEILYDIIAKLEMNIKINNHQTDA